MFDTEFLDNRVWKSSWSEGSSEYTVQLLIKPSYSKWSHFEIRSEYILLLNFGCFELYILLVVGDWLGNRIGRNKHVTVLLNAWYLLYSEYVGSLIELDYKYLVSSDVIVIELCFEFLHESLIINFCSFLRRHHQLYFHCYDWCELVSGTRLVIDNLNLVNEAECEKLSKLFIDSEFSFTDLAWMLVAKYISFD